jgi:hypothetical protein
MRIKNLSCEEMQDYQIKILLSRILTIFFFITIVVGEKQAPTKKRNEGTPIAFKKQSLSLKKSRSMSEIKPEAFTAQKKERPKAYNTKCLLSNQSILFSLSIFSASSRALRKSGKRWILIVTPLAVGTISLAPCVMVQVRISIRSFPLNSRIPTRTS